uniref:hypothetical protein n=1 Tax=Wolbachia endosymbiont of Psylliodes chrysocephala TaxID=2883236 RepID=UPI00209E0BBF|nr:hypothetical protein [Wolbachia endosymbiont of Psylliodes chrysocephala]
MSEKRKLKQTIRSNKLCENLSGKRSAGNPHAAFEEAGTGNVTIGGKVMNIAEIVEALQKSIEAARLFSTLLKYAEETTEKDLEKIAKEAPIIKQAYDELDKYHWLEKDLAVYEDRMDILQKEEGIFEQKFDDGKIEGKIEVAKNLLKAGVSVDL